jgi:hypothetical protein
VTFSMLFKRKVNFRHIQLWLWVCLSKEKLTLDITKYDFEYVCQINSQFFLWQTYSKLYLDISKLNFFFRIKIKILLLNYNIFISIKINNNLNVKLRNTHLLVTLSMFVKGKVDFRHIQIWLLECLLKEKLTLNMFKYDFEYACQKKN